MIVFKKFFAVGMLGGIFFTGAARSAPVMETGVGSSEPILATVLPDHAVPNLYYVFPQSSEMVVKPDGRFDFLYVETRRYRTWGKDKTLNADARVWIQPSIQSDALTQKMNEIRATNPNAKFAAVTVFKTEVMGSQTTDRYFLQTDCTAVSGPLEVPVYCRLSIDPRLARGFKTLLRHSQARVFHYVYHFYGFAEGKVQPYTFAVPLKLGSLQGQGYFVDQFGDDLD